MSRALQLAARGLYSTHPNPRVGCVLVSDDRIIGQGWHERAGGPHAEINALAAAGDQARGSTAYVSLEPCCHQGRTPPCTDALLAAGVRRVVAAMVDPDPRVAGRGLAALKAAGIDVASGLLEAEAERLNAGFVMRTRHGRPLMRCKLAMSMDGRTALASGESRWITAEPARHDVQRLRARASAIMTGIGTIRADDPALNVRWPGSERQPVRVVLDPELDMPPTARTLYLPGEVVILTAAAHDGARAIALRAAGAEVVQLAPSPDGLELTAVTAELGRRGLNEVHTECGPTLAGALLQAGLVDELVVYMAPLLLGDNARGLLHLPGLTRMAQRRHLEILDIRAVGQDWRITARPQRI